LRLALWLPQRRTCAQMFQFWWRLTNQMTHHPTGRTVADHSLVREQSYQARTRDDAIQRVNLGAYQA
jgi:hypothetical protein